MILLTWGRSDRSDNSSSRSGGSESKNQYNNRIYDCTIDTLSRTYEATIEMPSWFNRMRLVQVQTWMNRIMVSCVTIWEGLTTQ